MYKFENTGSNQSSAPLEEIIREEEGGGTGVITRERLRWLMITDEDDRNEGKKERTRKIRGVCVCVRV